MQIINLTTENFYPWTDPPESLRGVYEAGDVFLALPGMVEVLDKDYKLGLKSVKLFNTSGGVALEDVVTPAYKVTILPSYNVNPSLRPGWAYRPKTLYPVLGELNTFFVCRGKETRDNIVKGVSSALQPLRKGAKLMIRQCVVAEEVSGEMYFAYSMFTWRESLYSIIDKRQVKGCGASSSRKEWEVGC